MASVNQTGPHCVNQMGKTHSKRLAAGLGTARHGRGTAWARHAMCELALKVPNDCKLAPENRVMFKKLKYSKLGKQFFAFCGIEHKVY